MTDLDLGTDFRLGEFLVEPARSRISGPGGERRLPRAELALLICLAEHAPRAVDRNTLKLRALGDATASDEVLNQLVRSLRHRLGDTGHASRYIATLPRVGYSLVAGLGPASPPQPQAAAAPAAAAGDRPGPLARVWSAFRDAWWLRVSVTYGLGAVGLVQVVNALFPALYLPMFGQTLVVLLALAGYPVTLALIWAVRFGRRRLVQFAVPAVALVASIAALLAAGPALQEREAATRGEVDTVASLAVLPFADLSPDGATPQLLQGLSEELASRFFAMGLRVVPQASLARYRGRTYDARRIGRELGVGHVLHGSMRRDAERLRLVVYLTDTSTGDVALQQTFDRDAGELLAVQNELSAAVAGALNVVITPSREQELREANTEDPRAHHYYVLGMGEFRQSPDLSHLDRSVELLEKATAVDPGYARAYAGLCRVLVVRHGRLKSADAMRQAETACLNALERGPANAETELALADLYVATGRYFEAERVCRALLEADDRRPVSADAHVCVGQALAGQGSVEPAARSLRDAVDAEPSYWRAHRAYGNFLLEHGCVRAAADEYRILSSLLPGSASALTSYGAVLLELGQYALAESKLRRALEIEPQPSAYSNLGTLLYFRGEPEAALEQYATATGLGGEHYTILGNMADALWQLEGRRAAAVEAYRGAIRLGERALEVGDSNPELFALLAFYNARAGNAAAAGDLQRQALATGSGRYKVVYYAALTALELGDREEALRLLGEALRGGCPVHLVTSERAFAQLAGTPGYDELLARHAQGTPPPSVCVVASDGGG